MLNKQLAEVAFCIYPSFDNSFFRENEKGLAN